MASSFADLAGKGGLSGRVRDLWWLMHRVGQATRRHMVIWIALAVIGGLMGPIQLWATSRIADAIQARSDGVGFALWPFAALWILTLAMQNMGGNAEFYMESVVQERGGERIALDTLRRASEIELIAFDHQPLHDRVAVLLSESETRARDVIHHALELGKALPGFVTWVAVLVAFDWRMLLLALLPSIPSMYAWFSGGSIYWDVYKEQTRERRLAQAYADALTEREASREVRMLGLAETFMTRWEQHFWQTAKDLRRRGLILGARQRGTSIVSSTIQIAGLTWYIATLDRDVSAGSAIVVVMSYFAVSYGLYGLANPVQQLGQASGFAREVRTFIDVPEPVAPSGKQRSREGGIVLDELRFTWPGAANPVIDGVSLTIAPGETIALVGENGAGKSTLIRLLSGMYLPTTGSIRLDGMETGRASVAQLAARVGVVFQDFQRFPLTLRDNVAFGDVSREADDAAIATAMERAGAGDLLGSMTEGAETWLGREFGTRELSGGEWQRVALARAFYRDADLLILDEPTSALDPRAEQALFERFGALVEDRTAIVISHRLASARFADRILVLADGRLVESGTHEHLVAAGGTYAAMFAAQAAWYR